ncbi:AI-2E family transporter [Actinophytocola glycyrrhizae]|uniref:AI-2E family transporter n=1 Tax=Actinophytocola glycyrrhizae TaxID=2044873 RepID=A0ABV9RU23_9PSEU
MPSPPRRLARPLFTARGLHRAAVISLELAAVVLGLWVLRAVVKHFGFVLVPVAVALLLSALLSPAVAWLRGRGLPRGLSVVAVLVMGLAVVSGLVTFVVLAVTSHFAELSDSVAGSVARVQTWLSHGPLGLDANLLDRGRQWLQAHEASLVSDVMTAFTTFGSLVAGAVLTLVILVMFLLDGSRMWDFLLRLWRVPTRRYVDEAGREAFHSVVMYVRVTALIALVDAAGIGIGLLVVGVPLVVPLTALVFLGAFVPYVGAIVSGALAVAVTLVSNGPVAALIMLGVVIAVQQLEGNVLQPMLAGNFVRLHPLVVLLALTVGAVEGGIAGVLLAVPVTAAIRAAVLVAAARSGAGETDPPAEVTEDVHKRQ